MSNNYSPCKYYIKILNQHLKSIVLSKPQQRNLNVHEYVSYSLLNSVGIETPEFAVAKTPAEAKKVAQEWKTRDMVVKAQVLAGGRGKGTFSSGLKGGVRHAETPEEVEELVSKMIGYKLVTKQTGAVGKPCNLVMVTKRKFLRKEFYFAIMMERSFGGPAIIASARGGVNIEKVAKEYPKAIAHEPVDIVQGITREQCEEVATRIGLSKVKDKIADVLMNMYKLFVQTDALLIEINPYAEDAFGKFMTLDAKCRFDDNAEYRQKELFSKRDVSQEDRKELDARKFDLSYIALDGNIGCLVNGAGLAMATMDIISLHGGAPANFLDVGGGATAKAVEEAFRIINEDDKVSAILVNIFGGIMSCYVIAEGIIQATKTLNLNIPVVCRLLGLQVMEAHKLIKESGLKIIPVSSLEDAAKKVVDISKIVDAAKKANLRITFDSIEHS